MNMNKNFMVTEKELELRLINFIIDCNLYYKNNLRLLYFLIHAQRCSVSDAAKILGRSRRVIYDKVLFFNPAFDSEWKSGFDKKRGGHQRMISLSKIAREYSEEFRIIAEYRLDIDECRRLKKLAEKMRRKEQISKKKIEDSVEFLVGKLNDPGFSTFLITRARLCGLSREELYNRVKTRTNLARKSVNTE